MCFKFMPIIFYNQQKLMIKSSAVLFKQGRNMKRNQTMLSYSTAKDIITSAKDLKKVRSSKQIDISNYMENKNEKIKNIDEKLQVHQSQINKNHQIIEELSQNFTNLKTQIDKEKENVMNQERKNKLLRDEIERTNKILRSKNSKIQELSKKLGELEKENQALKIVSAKVDEYGKTISNLRAKINTAEQTISDQKSSISEKDKQLNKIKQKMLLMQSLRAKQQEYNNQLLGKDMLIGSLRQSINQLQIQKTKQFQDRLSLQQKSNKLISQMAQLRELNNNLKGKADHAEKVCLQMKNKVDHAQAQNKESLTKMKNKDKEQFSLKTEISELKLKNTQLINSNEEKAKLISQRDSKIERLSQKIKQLENNLGQNYKQKDKLKSFEDKIQLLKKRLQNLQTLYYSMIPQIQCPFGHELKDPVTIIPCGHNYCLGCKKGYHKQCMQCSGKLKIEAVYRNQLMDDIIGMVGGIKQIIQILK